MRIRWDYISGRVIAWAIIALLSLVFGAMKAHAGPNANAAAALAACQAAGERIVAQGLRGYRCDGPEVRVQGQMQYHGRALYGTVESPAEADFGSVSSEDTSYWWDEVETQCAAGEWVNPLDPAECLNPQKCLARNALDGYKNVGLTTRSKASGCVAGCEFKAGVGGGGVVSTGVAGTPAFAATGTFEFSGNKGACGVPNAPNQLTPEQAQTKDPQICTTQGNATVCQKANGDVCYNSASGSQICWDPKEVGTKTDGPVQQERDPGTPPKPDTKTMDNKDTGDKTQSVTTTTTTTINNVTTTVTTTTTNYNGESGADAGAKGSGSGEKADGTGTPTNGGQAGGKGDEDNPNSSAGGADCTVAPTGTGDAILANVLLQTWKTRCALEKHAVTGDGDGECGTVASPSAAPACSGDGILCSIQKQAFKLKCNALLAKLANDLDAAGGLPDDAIPNLWDDHDGSPDGFSFDPGKLNMAAGNGDLFPSFNLEGQDFAVPQAVYDLIGIIRGLVVAAFMIAALWIVGRGN